MIKPENGFFLIYIIYNEKNRSGINKLYQLEKKKNSQSILSIYNLYLF